MDNQPTDQNASTQDAPQVTESPNANPAPQPVNNETLSTTPSLQPTNIETPSTPSKTTSGKKIAIIASIATIAIVLIIGAVFLLISLNKDSSNKGSDTNSSRGAKNDEKSEGNTSDDNKISVKTDWKKLEFSINGIKKQLPLAEEELMEGLDGWELNKGTTGVDVTEYKLKYSGNDTSINLIHIGLYKSQKTDKFNWVGMMLLDPKYNTTFETNGINEKSTQKDVEKLLGKPTESYEKAGLDDWRYNYYINGKDDKDGSLEIGGEDSGEVSTIILRRPESE